MEQLSAAPVHVGIATRSALSERASRRWRVPAPGV